MNDKERTTGAPARAAPPALEVLEPRLLLDGNVNVLMDGGELNISGDDLANRIKLEPGDEPNEVKITSVGPGTTTINGVVGPVFRQGVKRIRIKLEGGGDTLILDGLQLPRKTSVDTGTGDDTVQVINGTTAAGNLKIDTSYGNGTVEIGRDDPGNPDNVTIRGGLSIRARDGNDQVKIRQGTTVQKNVVVETYDGDDTVTVDGAQIKGNLTINATQGDDGVQVVGEPPAGVVACLHFVGRHDTGADLLGLGFQVGQNAHRGGLVPAAGGFRRDLPRPVAVLGDVDLRFHQNAVAVAGQFGNVLAALAVGPPGERLALAGEDLGPLGQRPGIRWLANASHQLFPLGLPVSRHSMPK